MSITVNLNIHSERYRSDGPVRDADALHPASTTPTTLTRLPHNQHQFTKLVEFERLKSAVPSYYPSPCSDLPPVFTT
jgi:hypothetical protein